LVIYSLRRNIMDNILLSKLHSIQVEILDEIVRICDSNRLDYFLIGGTLLGAIRHKGFIPWDDDIDIAMPRDAYDKFISLCNSELSNKYMVDSFENNSGYWLPFIKIRKRNTVYEEKIISANKSIPKGVWVDIFPLDNVKHLKSIVQFLQAKLVKYIRHFISIKQGYSTVTSIKGIILFNLFRLINTHTAFKIQHKIMTIWNDQETRYFVNLGSQYNYVKQTIPKDKYYPPVKVEFEGKLYNAPNDWDYILTRIYGDYMQLPPVEKRTSGHHIVKVDLGE
jgi:lipopolysaccharide cholinephosphotransferase